MFWNGTSGQMLLSWQTQDLFFNAGFFGFNTFNGDLFGISSSGLANGWHHVVAEFTNRNITGNKLYIDGVPQTLAQQRGPSYEPSAVVSANLRIGGLYGSASYRFTGQLDQVRIFNGALTAEQVSAEYTGAGPCGG
jgi:MSHA biogenesis protein MshQ